MNAVLAPGIVALACPGGKPVNGGILTALPEGGLPSFGRVVKVRATGSAQP